MSRGVERGWIRVPEDEALNIHHLPRARGSGWSCPGRVPVTVNLPVNPVHIASRARCGRRVPDAEDDITVLLVRKHAGTVRLVVRCPTIKCRHGRRNGQGHVVKLDKTRYPVENSQRLKDPFDKGTSRLYTHVGVSCT